MKVAVIGAGPAGMTAAYQLSKNPNVEVELFEASSRVGGMSKTLDLWGQKVDIGPHRFFSNDSRVNKLWLEVIEKDYRMVNRLTRIYYKEKLFHYPLKAFNALRNLGILEAVKCVLSYFKEKVSPTPQQGDFESWVTNRFGKRLFEIFFKTYSEKLWGIKCSELDADFAAQRIKKLSLYEAVKNAFFKGKNEHKTLVDQFAYPIGGTGLVYEKMKAKTIANGGIVHLSSPVKRVIKNNGIVNQIELESGEIKTYDHVISTMPLTLMVQRLADVPTEVIAATQQLKFRNTILVYLEVEGSDLFKDNWLYIHSSALQTGRITNFRNWVPEINGDSKNTILVLEYWCNTEDEFWTKKDAELKQLGKDEIRSTGLIKDRKILNAKTYRIPKCYPVYGSGYKKDLVKVEEYLSSVKGLSVIGRYGAFKYNNQDHSILMGLMAAENLLESKNNDLWSINTDYDNYQESSTITETGLVVDK